MGQALPGTHLCKDHQGNHSHYATKNCELCRAQAEIERLREALGIIERWEDFPESGRTWEDGTPMSYGAAFGSNGQRDYMRGIARAALAGKEDK